MNYIIRKKKIEDCSFIQKIITTSWNETYKGIVNDEFLNFLKENENARIDSSIRNFDENDNNELVLEVDGEVVGFIRYGISEFDKYPNSGEIYAFYIAKDYQKFGFGKKLFDAASNELKKMGYKDVIVGCIEGNKSNRFYKHIGGQFVGNKTINRGGQDLVENIYYYR